MTPATTTPKWYLKTGDKHAKGPEAITVLRREKHDDGTWEWRSNGDIEVLAERILECSRTFTATYGGERITLEAGVSRVSGDHELARSHPHHFRLAPSLRELSARAARAAAPVKRPPKPSEAPKRWRAGYLPPTRPESLTLENVGVELLTERRDRREPVMVNLTRDAWREISQAVERHADTETNGGIYGPPTYGSQAVASVHTALDCGYDRQFASAGVDVAALEAGEYSYRDRERDLVIAGSWHSEPGTHTAPSAADLYFWKLLLDRAYSKRRATRHVHLIVTADGARGWRRPEVAAYVMRREESDAGRVRWVCAPADVRLPR